MEVCGGRRFWALDLLVIVEQVKIMDQSLLLRGIFGRRWSDGVCRRRRYGGAAVCVADGHAALVVGRKWQLEL